MFIFLFILWYLSGVGSFVYWWLNEYDFTLSQIPTAVVVGVLGPLAWVLGHAIHGDLSLPDGSRVLFEKRSK